MGPFGRSLSLFLFFLVCLFCFFSLFSLLRERSFVFPSTSNSSLLSRRVVARKVLLRGVAGLNRVPLSINVSSSPITELSLFVRSTSSAREESFVFLVEGEWGCVLLHGGSHIKILWGAGLEIVAQLPSVVSTSQWHLLGFVRQRSEHKLRLYFEGREFFFVLGFDPPPSKSGLLFLGCPPAYRHVGSHLMIAQVSRTVRSDYERPEAFPLPTHAVKRDMSLPLLVEAIKKNQTVNDSFFVASFEAYMSGNTGLAVQLCSFAIAASSFDVCSGDCFLCSMALGSARRQGGFAGGANVELAEMLLRAAADESFAQWQREGLREVKFSSIRNRHELALDGLVGDDDDEDEMIEVELYKNQHEWLGDVYYHGKRNKAVDMNKAFYHYRLANTTKAKLQLARMHFQKQKMLESNSTFRALLEEAFNGNSSDAANLLGCIAPNDTVAVHLFETATQMDPPDLAVALTNSGIMHTVSSLPQNLTLAKKYWLRSAAQGDYPGLYWLAREGADLDLASRALFHVYAVRYHVLRHVASVALAAALKNQNTLATRLYVLCGMLGTADCFFDAAHVDSMQSRRWLQESLRLYHPGSSFEKAYAVVELLRFSDMDESDAALALASAERNSEALYNVGWFLENRRKDFVSAKRAYATLFKRSRTWVDVVVGFLAYSKLILKPLIKLL